MILSSGASSLMLNGVPEKKSFILKEELDMEILYLLFYLF
jgi:hypothetical protein